MISFSPGPFDISAQFPSVSLSLSHSFLLQRMRETYNTCARLHVGLNLTPGSFMFFGGFFHNVLDAVFIITSVKFKVMGFAGRIYVCIYIYEMNEL